MSELIQFLAAPFVLCLILAGIHCYLGLHVLARGIIFIDLSLAQVSAVGAAFGMLLDVEMNTTGSYFISLGFTFLASGLFAFARRYERVFSQEALIGIVYAFSAACVILFMDRLAHGA